MRLRTFFGFACLLAFISVCPVACSSDDEDDTPSIKESVLYGDEFGKKEWQEYERVYYKDNQLVEQRKGVSHWIFYEGNVFSNGTYNGTWEINGNTLKLKFQKYYSGITNETQTYRILELTDNLLKVYDVYEDDEYDYVERSFRPY